MEVATPLRLTGPSVRGDRVGADRPPTTCLLQCRRLGVDTTGAVENRTVLQNMRILVLNSGSSSQKTCLFEIGEKLPDDPPACLWEGRIQWGSDSAAIVVKNSQGIVQEVEISVSSREEGIGQLLSRASLSTLSYEHHLSQPVIRLGMAIITWPRESNQSFGEE